MRQSIYKDELVGFIVSCQEEMAEKKILKLDEFARKIAALQKDNKPKQED